MLMQFATGSVDEPQASAIQISVLNAGIQPSNVSVYLFDGGDDPKPEMFSGTFKIEPQTESLVFDETELKGSHWEAHVKVDSPSLIFTVKAETQTPLFLQVNLVDTWSRADWERPDIEKELILLQGYFWKGVPF